MQDRGGNDPGDLRPADHRPPRGRPCSTRCGRPASISLLAHACKCQQRGGIMPGSVPDLGRAGSFALGRWRVHRIGYGAMQLAGDGVFGPPRDRDEALRVLRAAVDGGVDHIDTAQYYGPGVVNELIREALSPYPSGLAIVGKEAARRDAAGALLAFADPDQLPRAIGDNLATRGISAQSPAKLR